MRTCLPFVMWLTACDVPSLDFNTNATSITVTSTDGKFTHVEICGGSHGLIGCNNNLKYQVSIGFDATLATAGILSFGLLTADFASADPDVPVTALRIADGANGTASLPPPFTLSGPSWTETLARGMKVVLGWDTSGTDQMSWHADLGCNGTSYFSGVNMIDDTGQLVISTDDLPEGQPGTCHTTITLTRARTGIMYSPFEAGSEIVGQQTRVASFQLAQ